MAENHHCRLWCKTFESVGNKVVGKRGRGDTTPWTAYAGKLGLKGASHVVNIAAGRARLGELRLPRLIALAKAKNLVAEAEILEKHFQGRDICLACKLDFSHGMAHSGELIGGDDMNGERPGWNGEQLPKKLYGVFLDTNMEGGDQERTAEFTTVDPGPDGVVLHVQTGVRKNPRKELWIGGNLVEFGGQLVGPVQIEDQRGFTTGAWTGRYVGRAAVLLMTGPRWGNYTGERPMVIAPTLDEAQEQFDVERQAYEAARGILRQEA